MSTIFINEIPDILIPLIPALHFPAQVFDDPGLHPVQVIPPIPGMPSTSEIPPIVPTVPSTPAGDYPHAELFGIDFTKATHYAIFGGILLIGLLGVILPASTRNQVVEAAKGAAKTAVLA